MLIQQSHGGSGKQARGVIDGLPADVVTLALAYDIDAIAMKGKRLPPDWQKRLPFNSAPYTSTIVFLVRKGNPKGIKDWDDLARPEVAVVMPNPKTSGGARWNYLAAWGYALRKFGNDEAKARDFVGAILKNVTYSTPVRAAPRPPLFNAASGCLVTWKTKRSVTAGSGTGQAVIVAPSLSVLAEPPALGGPGGEPQGDCGSGEGLLEFLYTPEGQEIAARHHYRPRIESVSAKYKATFPRVTLFTVDEVFGGWQKAQKVHFDSGGIFDQIQQSLR